MRHVADVRSVFARNKFLISIVTLTFFSILILSSLVAYALLVASPSFLTLVRENLGSTTGYATIPPPYTSDLYQFIFLNNIGHFWNPVRAWVWIPFIGMFSLGFELVANAAVIGAVISFATLTKGGTFTAAGLTPHGIFEIPAFILEFSALARWHIATLSAIFAKLSGRKIERPPLTEGVKDSLVLSLLSVALFAIAAYVETFVTPRLLGL